MAWALVYSIQGDTSCLSVGSYKFHAILLNHTVGNLRDKSLTMMSKMPVVFAMATMLIFSACTELLSPPPANPKSVKILSVTITSLPFKNSNGNNWDVLNGPDVYFSIKWGVHVLFSSNKKDNLKQSDLPALFYLSTPLNIPDFTSREIKVLDSDAPDGDDHIGTLNFSASDYVFSNPKYPSTVELSNGQLKATLQLKWE